MESNSNQCTNNDDEVAQAVLDRLTADISKCNFTVVLGSGILFLPENVRWDCPKAGTVVETRRYSDGKIEVIYDDGTKYIARGSPGDITLQGS